MNAHYMRGYDQGYEDGAKYGQVPVGASFLLLAVGAAIGVGLGFLLSHL